MTSWEFPLAMTAPLSLNDREHYMKRARDVAEVRKDAFLNCRALKIPRLARVEVVLTYHPRDRRRRDPLNLTATLKPVQDGIVDAGVVPDDTLEFMESPMPVIGELSGKRHGVLTVRITEIA